MENLLSAIVVTGEGFTPHLLSAQTLREVFGVEPVQVVVSRPLTVLDYPNDYQVVVQETRIDVKRQRPQPGADQLIQTAIKELLSLWPLVHPKAIGINFDFGDVFNEQLGQADLISRLTSRETIEEALGGRTLIGSKHSFMFMFEMVKVTAQVTTDAVVAERPGFTLAFNAHHAPVSDVDAAVESQGHWYERAVEWGERLTHAN